MRVDAAPGTFLTGYVGEIGCAVAAVQDPADWLHASTGVFQNVSGIVPVTVAIPDQRGLTVVPGMNVTVHIHKS